MSTPLLLVDELCILVGQATKELILEVKKGEPRAPIIISGFLDDDEPKPGRPPEDETEKAVPFVIARFLTGEDSQQTGTATIRIIATTYSKHGQGWRDPLEVLERIRQELLRNRTLGKKFRLELPIKTEMPEDQPWPYWVAWMTTTWTIAQPIEEVDYGDY
ncbi:hypothetical protein SDC9_04142 [bioreactor metagenome]|uniref:Uncharacterized protein n=1 Tax=bioreactor metagenome TaxID=1076179 RepID=A0A644SV79_9ZZZZ|nr:hypothetical protein [Negativicutes bacterium]